MKGLRLALFVMLFSIFNASNALATSILSCQNENKDISIDLTIGSAVTQSIIRVYINAKNKIYSTSKAEEFKNIPIIIAQSFFEPNRIMLDITDENLENFIAKLRLFVADNNGEQVFAGILEMNDFGAFSVSCFAR